MAAGQSPFLCGFSQSFFSLGAFFLVFVLLVWMEGEKKGRGTFFLCAFRVFVYDDAASFSPILGVGEGFYKGERVLSFFFLVK